MLYPHEFFSFFGGFIDLPFLVVSFLKVFSVLLFQGVLYFPVKTKERVTLEANRKARGLLDFALDSGLGRLVENPPGRDHYVKEEAVFVIQNSSRRN